MKTATGTPPRGFTDETTLRVLQVANHIRRLKPASVGAQRYSENLPFYSRADRERWAHEMARTQAVEQWLQAAPSGWDTELSKLPEIQSLLDRSETFEESDLFVIKRFLVHAERLLGVLSTLEDDFANSIEAAAELRVLTQSIHPEVEPSPRFVLSDALSTELAEARRKRKRLRESAQLLRTGLETKIIETHGGRFTPLGYYQPTASFKGDPHLEICAGVWILSAPAWVELHNTMQDAEAQVRELELDLRDTLTRLIRGKRDLLETIATWLKMIDFRAAKVRLKQEIAGCWPVWTDTDAVRITGMFAPDIDHATPVDLDEHQSTIVLAGPNMGGKSTVLRALGLCQWCLQHGFPAPAAECEIPAVTHVFYVGSEDNPQLPGLSAFGREVQRLVEGWTYATPGLWLLDEIGRGTHPEDGASIAKELVEMRVKMGDRVVCATHFPELTTLVDAGIYKVAGLPDPDIVEDSLAQTDDLLGTLRAIMDYRLVRVTKGEVPRDARVIARALGLPVRARTNEDT